MPGPEIVIVVLRETVYYRLVGCRHGRQYFRGGGIYPGGGNDVTRKRLARQYPVHGGIRFGIENLA